MNKFTIEIIDYGNRLTVTENSISENRKIIDVDVDLYNVIIGVHRGKNHKSILLASLQKKTDNTI